jgi:hypothetical protein
MCLDANSYSCLFQISVILLHRPYITRGHLFNVAHAPQSFQKCATAAIRLAYIVNTYSHAFTIRRAPYFIAYSAYVATTILIRLSSYQKDRSVPHQCLHACLIVMDEAEKINAGVKRAMFVVSRLLFAVARRGPNPFPQQLDNSPWGRPVSDKFEIDTASIDMIIKTFSVSSPDAATERPELGPSLSIDPGLSGLLQTSGPRVTKELDKDAAAQLLASLRWNTAAIAGSLQQTPKPPAAQEITTPLPDMIFGLHSEDALQSWPDFNDQMAQVMANYLSPILPIAMTETSDRG